jgi:CRISPR-associated protein Cst2
MNLFATVLTYPAPSANYRGESELNRSVIQKVTDGRFDYPIFSPESMRNALREILGSYGLLCNRERLHDEDQLAVRFADYPDPEKYADDFFFGYLVAASGKDRSKILKEIEEKRGKKGAEKFAFKRDSVFRMNLAKALEPYRHNTVFTQSPQDKTPKDVKSHVNADSSQLLHRETAVTAFQYPFALNLNDCKGKPDWTRKLLKGVGELNDVAGNHARSYFEMAPASIIIRLTDSLVAGFNTYCFKSATAKDPVPDVLQDILRSDYPAKEFYLGGELVKRVIPPEMLTDLQKAGVTVERDPRKVLDIVADKALGG